MAPGTRVVGKPPYDGDDAMFDEIARRTVLQLNAIGASRIKYRLMRDVDPRGFIGRADLGLAHQLVAASAPVKTATGWRGDVAIGPPRDRIAIVLEKGRRRGARMPPPDALIPWAKRKLRNQIASGLRGARTTGRAAARFKAMQERAAKRGRPLGKRAMPTVSGVGPKRIDAEAKRIAFALARSIAKKGTPGLHMFAKTAAEMRAGKAAEVLRRVTRTALAEKGGRR